MRVTKGGGLKKTQFFLPLGKNKKSQKNYYESIVNFIFWGVKCTLFIDIRTLPQATQYLEYSLRWKHVSISSRRLYQEFI